MHGIPTRSSVLSNAFGTLLEALQVEKRLGLFQDRTKHARRAAKDFVECHCEALTVAKAVTLSASVACGLVDSDRGMAVALMFCVGMGIAESVVHKLAPSPLDVPVIDATEHPLIVSVAQAGTALTG